MNRIDRIARDAAVQKIMADLERGVEKTIDLAIEIQQIPAPTFEESLRAAFVQGQFENLDLADVHQDKLCNVYARLPANPDSSLPSVVVSAHLDTVFPAGTDLTLRRDGGFVHGPGIGDNSTGVAGILTLAKALAAGRFDGLSDIWFVANVGEEGLGDLRGMRAAVDSLSEKATYLVVEGGLYGQISHQGIGVRRFRIDTKAEGGHSWGAFGNSSAIHCLGRIIAQIDELEVPSQPKTTFNVGVIEGGTSINTIAQTALLLLDLRSEEDESLIALEREVEAVVANASDQESVTVSMTLIGNRPSGRLSRDSELVQWAEAALRQVGCQAIEFVAGSTDANIPLSRGIPAVCIGLAESGNTHRLDEYLDPTHLGDGLKQLLLLTLATAGYEATPT